MATSIIDVHHHVMPPKRLEAMRANKIGDGPTMNWTLDKTFGMMESGHVDTCILSISGVRFGGRDGIKRIVRECNDYEAELAAKYPGKFGLFATLPMPEIDDCMAEIAYALDDLKADGVVVQTSYGSKWLGDPAFAPILDELNRRKAVVFVHPNAPDCTKGVLPLVRDATIEYGTDTTRAMASLMFGGTIRRCPDIKFIFCHGGGTITSLIARFEAVVSHIALLGLNPELAVNVPNGPEEMLRTFYYDIAQTTHKVPIRALIELVGIDQVIFGTDYPYKPAEEHTAVLEQLGLSEADIHKINRANVERILPRFRK